MGTLSGISVGVSSGGTGVGEGGTAVSVGAAGSAVSVGGTGVGVGLQAVTNKNMESVINARVLDCIFTSHHPSG